MDRDENGLPRLEAQAFEHFDGHQDIGYRLSTESSCLTSYGKPFPLTLVAHLCHSNFNLFFLRTASAIVPTPSEFKRKWRKDLSSGPRDESQNIRIPHEGN